MKTRNNHHILLLSACLALLVSCSKSITDRVVASFEPVSVDSLGGTWKTIHVSSGSEVTIAAPDAVGSTAYQSEISQVLQLQQNKTSADDAAIKRWKNSGVISWNEIARELVAKYNIPPEANPDGTYPVPSAANPGAYPKFPFANPPYASRAYAYLHTAIYDALVSCWNYKFLYNRKSPAVNDNRVKAMEDIQSNLPSYPSEDATVAQVSYIMLKALFPNDTVMLKATADEQKRAKMISGVASASDVAAGEAIGTYVAAKALARLKTDGMGNAVGNPNIWAQLEQDALARGTTTPWKSMETPARPPMLPLFGNVKLWNLSTFQRDSLRPGPPPTLGSPEYNAALDEVRFYSRNPSSTTWRIAMFWSDGASTYTPPGHWNEIACNQIAVSRLNELRTARTLSLLNMAMADAAICCWDTKSYYYFPRPSQIDPSIKTIGLPNFPSYTSGHSTFSAAAATVLGYLFPSEKTNFESMANEASNSRIYGAIHYRFDCVTGLACGRSIGSFSVKRGQNDGSN